MGKQLTSRTGTLPGSRSDPVCQLDVGEKDAEMGEILPVKVSSERAPSHGGVAAAVGGVGWAVWDDKVE